MPLHAAAVPIASLRVVPNATYLAVHGSNWKLHRPSRLNLHRCASKLPASPVPEQPKTPALRPPGERAPLRRHRRTASPRRHCLHSSPPPRLCLPSNTPPVRATPEAGTAASHIARRRRDSRFRSPDRCGASMAACMPHPSELSNEILRAHGLLVRWKRVWFYPKSCPILPALPASSRPERAALSIHCENPPKPETPALAKRSSEPPLLFSRAPWQVHLRGLRGKLPSPQALR